MKNVMTIAWGIAKEAVVKFGGKVKEYFAQALKMAWAQVKNAVEFKTEEIMAIGAKGHVVYVAIPATHEVKVLNAINIVKKAEKEVTNNSNGVTYNVFAVEADATEAPFSVVVGDKKHNLTVNIAQRKVVVA